MKILLSKPDALGDQLIVAGAVQALQRLQPGGQLVWHVRSGMEAIAPLLGAAVFLPQLDRSPETEAARLAAESASLVLLPFPLSAFEPWTDDLRRRVAWWAAFLRKTQWDATILALANRNWVGDFTSALAPAPVRLGFEPSAARQPLVNEAQSLANRDAPSFTATLQPSFERSESVQLRELLTLLEPRLSGPETDVTLQTPFRWQPPSEARISPRVLIAPGIGGDPRRAWGIPNLRQVADALQNRGAIVNWIEGPGDAPYLDGLPVDERHPRLKFGPHDLGKLAAALAEADLFLCHDTAYGHLAAGIGVPTVALYGAGQGSRFHPAGGRVKLVQSRIPCAGCQWHCLFNRLLCVADIPPETVIAAAEQMLAGNAAPVAIDLRTPLATDPAEETRAIRRRLQEEILALNADRFARLQIIQSLLTNGRSLLAGNSVASNEPSPASRLLSSELRLSIIIPMGRPERVSSTLASLAAQQSASGNWEIVLVGVEAESVARAHPHLPIVPVALARNELPPRTRCLGVERATGEWYLFIDDDVELAPDCYPRFRELLTTAPFLPGATPQIGAIGLRLPCKSGRFFEKLTDISNFWAQQNHAAEDREWLYSAAIFVRAEAYHRSGGFNPELPNGEDVDLTRRIAAAGYRLRYEPALVALHNHRRGTLLSMWRYFWRNGNAARYFFAPTGGTWPFSIKTAWLKSWSDLRMNRNFQRARGVRLGLRTPLIWLNYLIVETSLEWHWQEYLWQSQRFRELPASSAGDRSAVKAFHAFRRGATLRGIGLYAVAMLQNFADPVRR